MVDVLGRAPLPPPAELARLHQAQNRAVVDFWKETRDHRGRGIVTTIYDRDFASVWVLLSELARLGVKTPIEAFHLPGELSPKHGELAKSLNLDLRIRELQIGQTQRFSVKPFAIWKSTFCEVLWIDADNIPIRDPVFLFDDPEYRDKGSLFWRDISGVDRSLVWHPATPVWRVFNVLPNDAEEFETGQLLIDKERCWAELGLTVHFNAEHETYYQYVWGDKDTFRLAWQGLAMRRNKGPKHGGGYLSNPPLVPYGFMPYGPFSMGRPSETHKWGGGTVLVQRDRDGRALFNHRTGCKFALDGENVFNGDLANEAFYHEHVARLRAALA